MCARSDLEPDFAVPFTYSVRPIVPVSHSVCLSVPLCLTFDSINISITVRALWVRVRYVRGCTAGLRDIDLWVCVSVCECACLSLCALHSYPWFGPRLVCSSTSYSLTSSSTTSRSSSAATSFTSSHALFFYWACQRFSIHFHLFAHLHSMLNALSHLLNARSSATLFSSRSALCSLSLSLSGCAALLQQQLPFSAAAAAVAVSASRMSSSCRCWRRRRRLCSFLCVRVHVHVCTFVCACVCVWRRGSFWYFLLVFQLLQMRTKIKVQTGKKGVRRQNTHTHTHTEHALWRSLHVSRRQRTQTQTQMRNKEWEMCEVLIKSWYNVCLGCSCMHKHA